MNLGYSAQALRLHIAPDRTLLPSQQYAARVSMDYTRRAMLRPEKAALVNLFMPCELLHAMDVCPMSTEGVSAFLAGGKIDGICVQKAEEMGIPDSYCFFHKTLLGAIFTGLLQAPRFIMTTNTVCDANYSTFNMIAEHCNTPKFFLDVPGDDSEEAIGYVSAQLKKMICFMEDVLECKLNWERLLNAVEKTNAAVMAHDRFLSSLASRQMPSSGVQEMYRLLTGHVLLGTDEAGAFYQMLAEDAERGETGTKKRILWCHVLPVGVEAMEGWFSAGGSYQLLPTDLHYDAMMMVDRENPLESMAKRLIKNHFNGSVDRRIDSVLAMAKRLSADGAVVFCHWGCKASNGSAYLLRDALLDSGIPAITVDGDAYDNRNMSEGQFVTRMEAFFEILEARP